jgi:hypothetical protein
MNKSDKYKIVINTCKRVYSQCAGKRRLLEDLMDLDAKDKTKQKQKDELRQYIHLTPKQSEKYLNLLSFWKQNE